MEQIRLISADSHVNEPKDLWSERLEPRFRDRAPRVETTREGKLVFIASGIPPASVAQGFARGLSGEQLRKHLGKGYEAASAGGWDPAARLKDQDIDGVELEVLYTTLGMRLFALPDKELMAACFATYNDWLAEFCAYAPKRLVGIGLLPINDIAAAVRELKRCERLGLRGAMIPVIPADEHPYGGAEYEPLWQAASELGIPLSLHSSTGQRSGSRREIDPATGGVRRSLIDSVVVRTGDIQRSLASLIFGGVLSRFPHLQVLSVENGAGWIPYYMFYLDHMFEKYPWYAPVPGLEPPSFYLRRQVFATFQDDPVAAATYHLFGENNYMWASDFPHADSTWPDSRRVIERDFGATPGAVRHKIVFENVVRLYRLQID